MSTLRQALEDQSRRFASEIVNALRSASLDELMSIAGGEAFRLPKLPGNAPSAPKAAKAANKEGRLNRRSPEDITRTLDNILAVLAVHPEGLRAEQIKEALNLDKREMPKPLALGLETGALTKSGNKRATTYFAGSDKKGRARKN